jgi:predicted RNase H-related nuclease YkuK (DUF458 family)
MKASVTLFLVGTVAARTLDLPTVKNALNSFVAGVQQIDTSIVAITDANVNAQVTKITQQINKLSNDNKGTAAALKASKPLKISDLSGLIATAKEVAPTFEKTAKDLMSKREIINKAGQADKLGAALKNAVPVIVGIVDAAPGQLPSIAKGLIPAGTIPSGAELTPKLNKALDDFIVKFKSNEPIELPDMAALQAKLGSGSSALGGLSKGTGSTGKTSSKGTGSKSTTTGKSSTRAKSTRGKASTAAA